jgi:hypothetical protein
MPRKVRPWPPNSKIKSNGRAFFPAARRSFSSLVKKKYFRETAAEKNRLKALAFILGSF